MSHLWLVLFAQHTLRVELHAEHSQPLHDLPRSKRQLWCLTGLAVPHAGSGLTALHLAAVKGSASAVRVLARSGASLDAPTLSSVLGHNLSRGSTALHIAAARGHAGCVAALLEIQAAIPGALPLHEFKTNTFPTFSLGCWEM
jgi:hypothetical protein